MNSQKRPSLLLVDNLPTSDNPLGINCAIAFECHHTSDLMSYKQVLSLVTPDCILLDAEALGNTLTELLAWTMSQTELASIPVLLILQPDTSLFADLQDFKGLDVLSKPLTLELLQFKMAHLMAQRSCYEKLQQQEQSLKNACKTIQSLERDLAQKTTTDDLTGLLSRKALMERAQREFKLSQRLSREVSILVLDVDRFKNINDTYGPDLGDKILIQIARLCKEVLRETDLIGRMGADEFAIVLPGTSLENSAVVAEKLRSQIPLIKHHIGFTDEMPLSLSIGSSCIQANMDGVEDLFRRANYAMTQAKRNGRNQMVTY